MAYCFDGVNQVYRVLDPTLPAQTFPFTMSAWARFKSNATQQIPLAYSDQASGPNRWYYLLTQTNNRLQGIALDGGSNPGSITNSGFLALNQWYHLLVIWRTAAPAVTCELYVDGVAAPTTSTLNPTAVPQADAISSGARMQINTVPTGFLNGTVGFPCIWNGFEPNIDQIKAMAAGIRPNKFGRDKILIYMPFYGGGGQEPDLSGNQHNMLPLNGPVKDSNPPVHLSINQSLGTIFELLAPDAPEPVPGARYDVLLENTRRDMGLASVRQEIDLASTAYEVVLEP